MTTQHLVEQATGTHDKEILDKGCLIDLMLSVHGRSGWIVGQRIQPTHIHVDSVCAERLSKTE
jgi:hypothetical protein